MSFVVDDLKGGLEISFYLKKIMFESSVFRLWKLSLGQCLIKPLPGKDAVQWQKLALAVQTNASWMPTWSNHQTHQLYDLVMTFTVRHGFSMALIEIDGKHRS